ncbi:MAG: hypothetical protein AAFQ94_22240 [Bacteroidota bacterium]
MKTVTKIRLHSTAIFILLLTPFLQSCFLQEPTEIEDTFYTLQVSNVESKQFVLIYQNKGETEVIRERFFGNTQDLNLHGTKLDGDQGLLIDLKMLTKRYEVLRIEAVVDGQTKVFDIDVERDLVIPDESDFTLTEPFMFSGPSKGYVYRIIVTDEFLNQ